jgi:hypothetical protein
MAGIGSYTDFLRDIHSSDMNQAIIASKNLLAVAEATQVPVTFAGGACKTAPWQPGESLPSDFPVCASGLLQSL